MQLGNTYSGNNQIDYGEVYIDGAQAASAWLLGSGGVGTTAYLGGTGTIGSISVGATFGDPVLVRPGDAATNGILTCGGLSLVDPNALAGFAARLNGTTPGVSYDRLVVNGGVTLANAPLSVTVG